ARSADHDLAVDHAHVGVLADAAEVALVDHHGAAIVHAYVDVVGVAGDAVLDRVAGHRAGSGASDGGDVLVALAAAGLVGDLVAGDGADDAAEDRARGRRRAAVGGNHVDAGDDAAVKAGLGGGIAAAGRIGRAIAVVRRGGGATGQGQGAEGGDAEQAGLHSASPEVCVRWRRPGRVRGCILAPPA